MSQYTPPFTITTKIIKLIAQISETIGQLSILEKKSTDEFKTLGKLNSIQSMLSLADTVAAIKASTDSTVNLTKTKQIDNLQQLHTLSANWQLTNQNHLLTAHKTLLDGIANNAGMYRLTAVANQQIQMTPQASLVPSLMNDLCHWLNNTDHHPLIVSSVLHYEFEFIHPFMLGNSQIGCFWQTQLLARWNPVFYQLSIESMVANCQEAYIKAINDSTIHGDSVPFIEFILALINTALTDRKNLIKTTEKIQGHHDTPHQSQLQKPHQTPQVKALLNVLKNSDNALSRAEIQTQLGLKDRKSFRERYLKPAIDDGLITMTMPEKPQSKSQKYRLL
ncbi:Fic family protein [Pseudoalteromonas mariniglutinosa]|uniref:Fic family protein n=1 Tax=Pseudoalteromonas mariniglutinosa TaxID=206042 RepID=UPI00384FA3C6